ncbi:MAG: DPP IV N-terminal domain-containing protein [Bacteroidetes bacterium]|nr:DPP IV N-terminal domain-containing protein [Bacteroidota bacterium]
MKRLLFILSGLVLPGLLFAQVKLMSMDEATLGTGLTAKNLSQLQWNGDETTWFFTAKNCLVKGYTDKPSRDTVLRLQALNSRLKEAKEDTLSRFPGITVYKTNRFSFLSKNRIFSYCLADGILQKLNSWNDNAQNTDLAPNTFFTAYTVKNSLFISVSGKEYTVEASSNPDISFGSEKVHRNEFGITKGIFWSPSGDKLAYYYMNETGVATYPTVDITDPIAVLDGTKYPMAGQKSHSVNIHIYSVATNNHIDLETGADTAKYLTNVTWSPDGRLIYIAVLNREQDSMWMKTYDASTGKFLQTLFIETDPKYVEPVTGPVFLAGDPSRFLWLSRRDGYNHFYLYESSGRFVKQLTKGYWEVSSFSGSDPEGETILFICNKDNPIGRSLCSIDIKSGAIKGITSSAGSHNVKCSADCKFFLDSYSSLGFARKIDLLDANGRLKQELLYDANPLKEFKIGKTSIFKIKNKENTDLYCRIIRPVDFDSTKRYPVIIYVYGGPHSQMVTESWLGGAGLFLNYLAEQGYVIFTLDNRGTSERGKAFEQAVFRHLGDAEVEDQMCGVNYLRSLPWIDTTRIGINGWSYGGFLTISMMVRNPGVFKVGVCGGPVIDWKYYEVMYGERYMDTPQTNPEGYKNASLLNYVKKLSGKLLIIQGYQDGTVVPQNGLSFIKKCVDEGKPVDYFIYPGHEHNVRGKDRIHLNNKMYQYFKDYL